MLHRLRFIFLLAFIVPLASANQRYQNYCMEGNRSVLTSGVTGTPKVQASYPQCTVNVYLAGTLTHATIYSDNAATAKANPFTAAVNGSYFFYAANGRYDVTMSAGGFPSPVTLGDVLLADPFASGGPVLSFNGRTGNVIPLVNDYTYSLIGGAKQGNTNVPFMAGTFSGGIGSTVCTDASGNATTSGCISAAGANEWISTSDYIFTPQAPGGSLVAGGINQSITLTPCPLGVAGADLYHYIRLVGGTGTAEATLITGGTCTSGANTGTITVTPANNHSGAWTVATATDGIQEAILGSTKRNIMVPGGGTHTIYGTIGIGNGDATRDGFTTQSTYNGLKLWGCGAGRDWVTPVCTKLQWAGASGGTVVAYHGPVSHVDLGYMAIDGNNLAGDIIHSYYGDQGTIHDMLLGNSKAIAAPNTYFALYCDYGCNSNVFQSIFVVQQQSGTSVTALHYNPGLALGVSQNTLLHITSAFPADTSTSFGLAIGPADNNQILTCDFQGAILTVTNATNATPIVITANQAIPGLATGQKVAILGVGGNTAANNTAANQQWTITKIDTSHFSLDGSVGNGGYTTGGSISGPGYALAFFTGSAPFPFENVFMGGAYFNALSYDDDAGHGPNQFFGISTGDGFLVPANATNTGLIHPDYYVNPDVAAGGPVYSRLIGHIKFVDSTNILGYMKMYPGSRCVMLGDGLETAACVNDFTVRRAGNTDANLNIYSGRGGGTGNAKVNWQSANGNTYSAYADQANTWFSIASPAGNALRLIPGSTAVGVSTGVAFASLPAIGTVAAGFMQYCTNCSTAAVCAATGAGHFAVSNGAAWKCD